VTSIGVSLRGCDEGAPLIISGVFAVALSCMRIKVIQLLHVPLPEVRGKMTEINGLTLEQPLLNLLNCV